MRVVPVSPWPRNNWPLSIRVPLLVLPEMDQVTSVLSRTGDDSGKLPLLAGVSIYRHGLGLYGNGDLLGGLA